MKKIILWVMVVLFMMPAMLQAGWEWGSKNKEEKKEPQVEQKQEDKDFKKTLEGKSPEEKRAAIQQYHQAQSEKGKSFQRPVHDKQVAASKTKLVQNTKLSEAQRNEALASREKRYNEIRARGEQRRAENAAFLKKIASDPNMTKEQKQEAIRAYFQSQKSSRQTLRQQKKTGMKTKEVTAVSGSSSSTNTVAQ